MRLSLDWSSAYARNCLPRFNAWLEGVRRLIDYQDPAYAGLYLDRLIALDSEVPGRSPACCAKLRDTLRSGCHMKTRYVSQT